MRSPLSLPRALAVAIVVHAIVLVFVRLPAERERAGGGPLIVVPQPIALERPARDRSLPVGQLFESVSTTMPADNVGGLLTSEYLDVLAYIFSVTGSPAGSEELTSDNMDAINVGPVQ